MARSNKALFIVVGAGASLGLGAGLFYLFAIAPGQAKDAARAEVEAWGARWAEARACLVGDSPAARDGAAAYHIREAIGEPPPEDVAKCDPLLYPLRRDVEESTGDAELEGAWLDIKPPLRELAKAVSWRIAKDKPVGIAKLRANLAAAIAGMDAQYDLLRRAADLEPATWPGAALSTLAVEPLFAEGSKVNSYEASDDTVVARVETDGAERMMVARGRDDRLEVPLSAAVEASTAGGWGMWRELDGALQPRFMGYDDPPAALYAGPTDAVGDPAGDGVELEPAKAAPSYPLFAVGGDTRAVVYQSYPDAAASVFRVRHSADGGATWSKARDVSMAAAAPHLDYARGRADFSVTEGQTLSWLPVIPGQPAEPQIISRTTDSYYSGQIPCVAGPSSWWLLTDRLFRAEIGAGPATEILTPLRGVTHRRCSEDRYVAVTQLGDEIAIITCTVDGCGKGARVPIAVGAELHTALVDGKLHVATDAGGVLLRFSPGSERFEPVGRIPDGVTVTGLLGWDGKLEALVDTEGGLGVVDLGAL